ncbi:unnamed protein product [Psylliodes chrysocephalus]|uniref:Protein sleepless n=1 Tax=Psylliodes chrysocephalus TaxID=3402493 RepID=A0A9P0GIP3_9CUCU|nr:unnamed protein product [Psylliodes chrysocephala]
MRQIALIFVVVLLMPNSGYASHKCYQCLADLNADSPCNSPVDVAHLDVSSCNETEIYCFKTIFEVGNEGNEEKETEMIFRSCGKPDYCGNPSDRIMQYIKQDMGDVDLQKKRIMKKDCAVCSVDLCNGIGRVQESLIFICTCLFVISMF